MSKPKEPVPIDEAGRARARAMSDGNCYLCMGSGIRSVRRDEHQCCCVHRKIFYACLTKYRSIHAVLQMPNRPRLRLEHTGGGLPQYSFPEVEFISDFDILARNSLEALDILILEHHFIQKLGWKSGCVRSKLNRGDYFHRVYAIADRLGRVFATIQPFCLFPTYMYLRARTMAVPRKTGENKVWKAKAMAAA